MIWIHRLRFGGWVGALCLSACIAAADSRWYTYEGCRLLPNAANDGDSFHVRTRSSEYIFRLYFVDTPETGLEFPERVGDQARHWGIGTNETLALGLEASEFTRLFLERRPFTVLSKREDARGQSEMQRLYGIVRSGDEDLAEALVAHGLARVFGMNTELPDGTPGDKVFARLRGLDRAARKRGLGGWRREPAASVTNVPTIGPGATAAPPVPTGVERTLTHSLAIFDSHDPSRFLRLLKSGARVTVIGDASPTHARIRFTERDQTGEAQCRKKDLGP